MGQRLGGHRPKIRGLIDLHDDYPAEVEYELIVLGLRWRDVGTVGFTWRDLEVVVECLPPESVLKRKYQPKDWVWHDPRTDLLAGILDTLNALTAYMGNQSGVSKSKVPKPITRPWDVVKSDRKIGGKVQLPLTDLEAWLAKRRAG